MVMINIQVRDTYVQFFTPLEFFNSSIVLVHINYSIHFVLSAEKIWSDEWSKFDGHIYKFFTNNTITAREARHACREHGALLASVNTPAEQTAIVEGALRKRTLSAFISGSDEITGVEARPH